MTITKENIHTKAGYTPFEGYKCECSIDAVLCRGVVVAEENKFVGDRGYGKLLYRKNNHNQEIVIGGKVI